LKRKISQHIGTFFKIHFVPHSKHIVSPLQGPAAYAVRETVPLYVEHMVTVQRWSTDLQMVKYCLLTASLLFSSWRSELGIGL